MIRQFSISFIISFFFLSTSAIATQEVFNQLPDFKVIKQRTPTPSHASNCAFQTTSLLLGNGKEIAQDEEFVRCQNCTYYYYALPGLRQCPWCDTVN